MSIKSKLNNVTQNHNLLCVHVCVAQSTVTDILAALAHAVLSVFNLFLKLEYKTTVDLGINI